MKAIRFSIVLLLLLAASPAWAGPAMEALQVPIDKGIALLRDPQYAAADKKVEQRDAMWNIVKTVFDFRLIAARALGRNWRQFSESEKAEFTDVFATLLGNTYIDKIQGQFSDERVEFVDETYPAENKAIITTRVVGKGSDIPVDYAMRLKGNDWLVYDVKVEGIGLVLNYRRQFNAFLSKSGESPASLIKELKEKNAAR